MKNNSKWLLVVIAIMAFVLVWPQVSKRSGWARKAEYVARETVAKAVMPGQPDSSDQVIHPDVAKWHNDSNRLRQVVAAGHETSVEWAKASTWKVVRFKREPVLLAYGQGGLQSAKRQLEDWRLPVRADFRLAITQDKLPGIPESLVPVAGRNADDIGWTYGWVWLSYLDFGVGLPAARWREVSDRTPVNPGEEVLYRANCILRPGQATEVLVFALPENIKDLERQGYRFFSHVRHMIRMTGVVVDIQLNGRESGGGQVVNSPPMWQELPPTHGAVTARARLLEPCSVEEVPLEFVFCCVKPQPIG